MLVPKQKHSAHVMCNSFYPIPTQDLGLRDFFRILQLDKSILGLFSPKGCSLATCSIDMCLIVNSTMTFITCILAGTMENFVTSVRILGILVLLTSHEAKLVREYRLLPVESRDEPCLYFQTILQTSLLVGHDKHNVQFHKNLAPSGSSPVYCQFVVNTIS